MLSSVRHILLKISRKSILFCNFTPLCLTYRYKLLKMPVKQFITARNYLLHSFLNIPMCKRFTKPTGINILWKIQFSIISGHTVIILWRVDVTSLTTFVSPMRFLAEIMLILWAIKSQLKGHILNRILHSWSFHIKFMKLAEGSFHKFHMKWPLV